MATRLRSYKYASWKLCAALVLAGSLMLLVVGCKNKLHLHGGQVHGFVVAEFANLAGAPAQQIYLPDVSVYLKNTVSGKKGAKVKTSALGFFITDSEKPGTYQVCAEAAEFVPVCDSKVLSLLDGTVVLDHYVLLAPEAQVIQGRITFKDGSPCFQDNNLFNTYATTNVSLHDASGKLVTQARPANGNGYYVLPKVPGSGTFELRVDCNGFKASKSLTLAGLQLSGGSPVNLGLSDSQPRITSVTASLSDTMIQQASPGSTITVLVRAYDPDGDTLHYKWTDGSKSFPSQDSSTIHWTLPTTPQANLLRVEVRDEKGGYARGFVSVSTAPWQPVFGGKVVDRATGLPVEGAVVTVNGSRLSSARNGTFQYSGARRYKPDVRTIEHASRYVINVRKSGYALASRAVYSPTPETTIYLDRATRTTCNPTAPCAANDQGPAIETQVQIEANAIVDQNGNPATSPVNIDVHGYDMTLPNPIPGDMAALDKSNNSVTMNSFGAISVDLSDASGNAYNLAPGKTAQISIPVNSSLLNGATPPATLPLWSYNEQTGVWEEQATATYNAALHAYIGNVPHFTAWNADAVFTNTACVFISIDPSTGPEIPFSLQGDPSNPPGYVNHPFTSDASDQNGFAFYRLIPNSVVKVDVYPASGPSGGTPLSTFTVNAGPTIDGSINYDAAPYYGIPPSPATECNGYDLATNQPPVIKLTIPTSPTFLTGLAPASPTTNQYWQTLGVVDASGNPITGAGTRGTFPDWLQTNGLGQGPGGTNSAGEVEAIYFNNADLQFGRDMHCLQGPGTPPNAKVACYVTNYGQNQLPQGDPQTGIANAEAHSLPIASVAMEYNPANAHNVISFYAYKADGSLLADPQLDSQTTITKPIPQICMACHGGTINGNNVDNVSFIAFDVYSFLYDNSTYATSNPNYPYATTPPGGVPSYSGGARSNQEDAFRKLNAMVAATNSNATNANSPIINLINGWYSGCGGVNTLNCTVTDTYAPGVAGALPTPGWSGHTALYQTIPRTYCRNCHSSLGTPSSAYPDWTQYSDFNSGLVPPLVCSSYLMPYAQVPFKRFWLSADPSAPLYLADPTTGLNITTGCPR